MRYFKRYWAETPGFGRDSWGFSWWSFETDATGVVPRQIEAYETGPTLRHDETHLEDQFGMLADQSVDVLEFAPFEMDHEEFEQVWAAGSRQGDS